MSKIFDALRKAEQVAPDLVGPPVQPDLQQPALHPREARLQKTEFGRLGSAVLGAYSKAKEGRVVLVAGAAEREGATYVTANLGRALAAGCGGDVLCVDTHFQKPSLARETGAKSGLGLADVLEKGSLRDLSDVLQRGDSANLYVLTTGRKRISAVSFIDNPEFDSMLATLRRSFRFILIDTPPILESPEAIHLASRADGVILVLRQGRLKREVLQKAMEIVQSAHAPVLGAVLNRRKFAIPDFVYKIIT